MELTPEQLNILEGHYSLLSRWNRVLNLTSVEGVAEAVERHYCESIFLAVQLPVGKLRIVDIGSGGGFPGFPIAVLRTDCEISLVESHRRKAVFLREASRGIGNIRVCARRAEEVEEGFDRAVSRAVSYKDLQGVLKELAPVADLLTGEETPPEELGFDWADGMRLPWGKARYLRSGVLRGTPWSQRFT